MANQLVSARVEAGLSYLLAGLIPQATIKIYPDAAHGFLFQHASEFAADVTEFLDDHGPD